MPRKNMDLNQKQLEERLAGIEAVQQNILEQLKEMVKGIKSLNKENDISAKEIIFNRDGYVSAIWNMEGMTDKLTVFLEQWMFSEKTISDKARLIYLCCLLERGEEEHAAVGLKKYVEERGTKLICDFLPLAWLANKIGLGGEVMKKAAYIFTRLEEERKEQLFKKCLNEKTFAIVGNSPDIIGSHMGDIIDSREIVFRMNTYVINEQYIGDTGTKVNALVDNSNFATLDHENHSNIGKLEWVYIPYDFWHIQISQFSNEIGRAHV